ncbi:AEC family transporter [Blautia glucerasea]|uniref:AEC family transporter n=1 Tax=Blautia glucerasea TaxID=536633 RepID=UPI002ED47E3B
MEISILLAKEIAKLFLIMFMGYAIVKLRLVKSQDSKCLSVVLVYLVIPCVILNAFQVDFTPDIQKNLVFAFATAIGIHILFLLANIPLHGALHLNAIEQANIIYPNAGILIFPLVQALQGQDYIIYSSAFMTFQLVLLWTHCKGMLCKTEKTDWKKILLNVNILSILIGLILFLFHIHLPADCISCGHYSGLRHCYFHGSAI